LGHGKSKWKSFFISNDVIHVQVERGGEYNIVEGIDTPEANDYMCVVHDVW
jgi:hypothetical protein